MSQVLIQQYLNQLQDLRKVSGTHREMVGDLGPGLSFLIQKSNRRADASDDGQRADSRDHH